MSDRFTWHGGGLVAAQAQFGGSDWVDLSTGISPYGWPVPRDLPIDWSRLPDEADLKALEAAAAAHFGADPACVCALPGTEIGLRMMRDLLPGPARWLRPSYATHGEMLPDATPVDKPEDAGDATLILANPNNPDGRLLDRDRLRDLVAENWLLIDEAFADTDPALSMADDVAEGRKLLIFRSFGKLFGLAGLRLGFLIGPPSFLAQVRHRLGAWPVSAPAIAIGTAAYRDRAWISAMRDRLKHESEALDALLARSGHRAIGASPLFRLIEVPDALALFEHLARRAILTRPFADNPHWLRIGLPASADAAARLDAALRDG